MAIEFVVAFLVVSFTSLGISVYHHIRQEQELNHLTKMIVDKLRIKARERPRSHNLLQTERSFYDQV
jgi:hypothetical protein